MLNFIYRRFYGVDILLYDFYFTFTLCQSYVKIIVVNAITVIEPTVPIPEWYSTIDDFLFLCGVSCHNVFSAYICGPNREVGKISYNMFILTVALQHLICSNNFFHLNKWESSRCSPTHLKKNFLLTSAFHTA